MNQPEILVLYYSRYGATKDLARLIAEGIETQDQCDLLKQIGCNYGQGYLFSKPLPADEFEKLIKVN